jgi:hypothetical protein
MIQQISVFAENRPGKIEMVTRILARANVNIRAVTISDLGDFGVIKLLVDDPARGCDELKAVGLAARLIDVLAVRIEDKVGGLDKAARALADKCVNVKHACGFVVEKGKQAVFVFEVDQPAVAAKALEAAGYKPMGPEDLAKL